MLRATQPIEFRGSAFSMPWGGEGISVTVTGADEYPVFESFDDYDLKENLLRGIYSYG